MRYLTLMLALAAILSNKCASLRVSGASPLDSFCVVVSDPATHAGREIAMRASIQSDGIENVMLFHADCPGIGLSLDETSADDPDPSVTAVLVKAFRSGMQKDDANITGTFQGRIAQRPGEIPAVVFEVRVVKDVTVSAPKSR